MGLEMVMAMVRRNDSLTSFSVSKCKLNTNGIDKFAEALKTNSKIRNFFVNENNINEDLYNAITAETDANSLLISIRTNPQSINAQTLPPHVIFADLLFFMSVNFSNLSCRYMKRLLVSCAFCPPQSCVCCMKMLLLPRYFCLYIKITLC